MLPIREIAIANRHPDLRLDRRAIARAIRTLDRQFASDSPPPALGKRLCAPRGELSLVFLTDAALAQLHAEFLADPTPTDVITFAGDPALNTAGEICVSVDAARRHVAALSPALSSQLSTLSSSATFSTELTLYLVHGWLHLAGYDDLAPAKKRIMRRAEARALALLHAAGALPEFALRR